MLIEQIIEFELRVPRPLVVHVFPKLAIFHHKTKISNARSSIEVLFNAKHIANLTAMYHVCFP